MATSVDEKEIEHFRTKFGNWWDLTGPAKGLHNMNKVRVPLVQDGLIKTGAINEEIGRTLQPFDGFSFLDVGCGAGIFSEALAELGATVHGIDPTTEFIEMADAHARLNSTLTNLKYFTTTVEEHALNYFEKYDAILLSEVIEHVNEKDMLLEACIKCLKMGGSIFITTFNKTIFSWFRSIVLTQDILRKLPRGTHKWSMFISPDDVTTILKKYQCKTIEVRGICCHLITRIWYWSSNTSNSYTLQAIKMNTKM